MAMTFNEMLAERSSKESIQDRRVVVTYERSWKGTEIGVVSNGPKTVREAWKAATGMQLFSIYSVGSEIDIGARLIDITASPESPDGQIWKVVGRWETQYQDEFEPNPLQRAPRIRLNGQLLSKVARFDRDGEAIVNSAGDPPDPELTLDEASGVITIQRNLAVGDPAVIEYVNHVNIAPFLGFPAESLRILNLETDGPNSENGVIYWSYSATIEYKKPGTTRIDGSSNQAYKGQDVLFLDQGLRRKIGGNVRAIVDSDGREVSTPVLLDGNGAVLSNPSASGASYRRIEYYPLLDFALLNLV
jgi:hypothetical protein